MPPWRTGPVARVWRPSRVATASASRSAAAPATPFSFAGHAPLIQDTGACSVQSGRHLDLGEVPYSGCPRASPGIAGAQYVTATPDRGINASR